MKLKFTYIPQICFRMVTLFAALDKDLLAALAEPLMCVMYTCCLHIASPTGPNQFIFVNIGRPASPSTEIHHLMYFIVLRCTYCVKYIPEIYFLFILPIFKYS